MTTSRFSFRAIVFGIALLLGVTAVFTIRLVASTVVALMRPVQNSERLVSQVPSGVSAELSEVENSTSLNIEEFDPSGDYTLDIEKAPNAFSDIESFSVRTREYLQDNGTYINRPIVPTGILNTKKAFEFAKIAVGTREISFETETVDGIRYEFIGHFYNYSEIIECDGCEYPAPLTGNLRKLKNGKVVAELEVKFYMVDSC